MDPASGTPVTPPRLRRGVVVAFDEARGIGEVEADGSAERFGFHCTRIAGGARSIALGATVAFEVGPGLLGRWEAAWLTEPGPPVSPGAGGPGGRAR